MKCTYDVHVHMGQYETIYYNPYKIIRVLAASGVTHAYISTTTSCMRWNSDYEKDIIIKHIISEIEEAEDTAKELGIEVNPLCWIMPKRYFEGESIETIMAETAYKGFKIHPLAHAWDEWDVGISNLMDDICTYAMSNSIPIFIHTGTNYCDRPGRFEKWFKSYDNVTFVLAHCKNYPEMARILSNYSNVYGDVSFCPTENVIKMAREGFSSRLLFGTDFPITFHMKKKETYNVNDLYMEYRDLLKTQILEHITGMFDIL